MNQTKKVPNLRFKGFTDDWEQRKLEDISIINPKSVIPEHFKYVDLESVVGTDLISFIETDKNSAPSRAQRVARTGDIFYQTVRPYQKNNYLFTLKDKDYVFSTGYAQIRSDVDNAFLMSYLQNENFVQTVLRHSTGTSYPAISPSDLAKISVFIPKKQKEQLKIGKTFSNIDNLITLQQRKLKQLQLLKKAFLQKLFADQHQKQPTLRFEGFHGDWEQRKGKEIFTSVSEKGYPNLPVLSATQDKGMIYRNDSGIDIKYNRKSLFNYKRIKPGDFVVHLRSFQGGFAYSNIEGIASPAYTVFSFQTPNKFNNTFWKEKFTSHNFIQLLKKVTYGIRDGRSISYSDFLTLKEAYPELKEQQKIGEFFNKIDHVISLQQEKLTHYQSIKKFLLQQMFI